MGLLSRIWEKLSIQIIGGLIVASLLAIGSGIWAFLQASTAPMIIPLVIGVFALIIFTINQINILRGKRNRNFVDWNNFW